jgi:hypothetical protein
MNRNVMYNGVLAPPEAVRNTGPRPNQEDTQAEKSQQQEETPIDAEEGAMNGLNKQAAEEEAEGKRLGRRPGCHGNVRVNEGDAW